MTDKTRDEWREDVWTATDPDRTLQLLFSGMADDDILALAGLRKMIRLLEGAQEDDHPHYKLGRAKRAGDILSMQDRAEQIADRLADEWEELQTCRCHECQAHAAQWN